MHFQDLRMRKQGLINELTNGNEISSFITEKAGCFGKMANEWH